MTFVGGALKIMSDFLHYLLIILVNICCVVFVMHDDTIIPNFAT